MTHPVSSPVSANSFPSSTTSRGHDENNFQFHPKAWPATNSASARKLAPTSSGPLSLETNTQPQQAWKAAEATPHVLGSSPLPPRSSSKHFQASPGRLVPLKTSMRDTISTANIKDPRQALAPVNKSLPPENEQSSDACLQPQRTASVNSLGRRSTNSTQLQNRGPSSDSQSIASCGEAWTPKLDDLEQALFEQRLTEDIYGVAVRKINHNGKSNLRYVKCDTVDAAELEVDANGFNSSRSVSSHSRSRFSRFRERSLERTESLLKGKRIKVLTWGKKKEVKLPLERFVCVRKGKTTERTRRNISPASRILSLITDDPHCPSLDIEAPTRLDRDKFAKAFSRFLSVPMEGDDARSIRSDVTPQSLKDPPKSTSSVPQQAAFSARSTNSHTTNNSSSRKHIPLPVVTADKFIRPYPPAHPKTLPSSSGRAARQQATNIDTSCNTLDIPDPQMASLPSTYDSKEAPDLISSKAGSTAEHEGTSSGINVRPNEEEASVVSSITGAGFDQEIVEELHLALTTLRAELEESRAEAARAVKVAEQAIQSAENNSSKDWNSTVTHKAAEAAALAQKRSAEAMSKARMAEERLEQEKKKASIWRKQAETAAEEAGHWQTRAAVAEVQRAAMAETLESERNVGGFHNSTSVESELDRLRSKLALETSTRRKLLNEVQDLRGVIRVYCRPRVSEGTSAISTPSQELLVLHREHASLKSDNSLTPLSFEFDGILGTDSTQQEVYEEMEAVCLSALDGYNACIMGYGQLGTGKTYTMLGKVIYGINGEASIAEYGILLQAAQQFFSVLKQRKDRYKETIMLNIVEVSNERLIDLLVGTEIGEALGRSQSWRKSSRKRGESSQDGTSASQSEKPTRMEIKTNRDGETTVHGLLSVEVTSFEDVLKVWTQSLSKRKQRLVEQNVDFEEYEGNSHIIGTFRIQSTNISSGVSTFGKIQFADLAASNVVPRRPSSKKASTPEAIVAGIGIGHEWKFANRSMATFSEVMTARSQFHRSVPYRNSTITHLLSDSLEADTKVILIACVSSEVKDLQETTCALQFAQTVRKVVIGKATKHTNTRS